MIAVGWGVFTWIVPSYARSEIGVGSRLIGLLALANALAVVVAQIPVARLAEGRGERVAMAIASLTFVAACLLVAGAVLVGSTYATPHAARGSDRGRGRRVPAHDRADAARRRARARGAARPLHGDVGLSWWLGLALAPTLGTQLLSVSPPAALLAAAGVALAAALSALALERDLPAAVRLTPRP